MRVLSVIFVATLIAVFAAPVSADTACAAGSTCTVQLTTANVQQLQGIVVTVTIDNTGSNTVLSFQLTNNPLTNSALGIDMVGWNSGGNTTANISTASTNFGGNNTATSNSSMSQFGKFDIQGQDPAGTGGVSSAITFTLNGLVTNFPSNSNGYDFAVHLRFDNNCSGFIGGPSSGQAITADDDPNCQPTAVVPEPGTLTLFGSGLLVVGGFLRRRFIR